MSISSNLSTMSTGAASMEIEATPVAPLMEEGITHDGCQFQLVISPNSTKYWIPIVKEDVRPKVGVLFENLEIGMQYYRNYGANGGFDVRTSTKKRFRSGMVRKQFMVCSKEGFKLQSRPQNSAGVHRERVSKRIGCMARAVFEYDDGKGYKITYFEEKHNHSLTLEAHYLNANRQLNYGHQKFVLNCVKANIGPAKTHRLYKEMVGGYENVGALAIDFKNFKRELMTYMSGADAQLIIQKFLNKQEVYPDIAFEYAVDENNQLTRIFWADQISRKNYLMFGDVVSFDATYNTNRNMDDWDDLDDGNEYLLPCFYMSVAPRVLHYMPFPPTTHDYFPDEHMSQRCIIHTIEGRTYETVIRKNNGCPTIVDGWREFIVTEDIERGFLLIFCPISNLDYEVTIVDRNDCDRPPQYAFNVKIKPTHVERVRLPIPMPFWREHIEGKFSHYHHASIKVGERVYRVDITHGDDGRRVLQNGDALQMFEENAILVGTTCTFFLVPDVDMIKFRIKMQ